MNKWMCRKCNRAFYSSYHLGVHRCIGRAGSPPPAASPSDFSFQSTPPDSWTAPSPSPDPAPSPSPSYDGDGGSFGGGGSSDDF